LGDVARTKQKEIERGTVSANGIRKDLWKVPFLVLSGRSQRVEPKQERLERGGDFSNPSDLLPSGEKIRGKKLRRWGKIWREFVKSQPARGRGDPREVFQTRWKKVSRASRKQREGAKERTIRKRWFGNLRIKKRKQRGKGGQGLWLEIAFILSKRKMKKGLWG